MAKLKLNPELLKVLLPVIIPIAKELAAKTETKLDDRIVAAIEQAVGNPLILALLLSILAGDTPQPVAGAESEQEHAAVLVGNAEAVQSLFGLFKCDDPNCDDDKCDHGETKAA